jgi:hypothetical protein
MRRTTARREGNYYSISWAELSNPSSDLHDLADRLMADDEVIVGLCVSTIPMKVGS